MFTFETNFYSRVIIKSQRRIHSAVYFKEEKQADTFQSSSQYSNIDVVLRTILTHAKNRYLKKRWRVFSEDSPFCWSRDSHQVFSTHAVHDREVEILSLITVALKCVLDEGKKLNFKFLHHRSVKMKEICIQLTWRKIVKTKRNLI